MTSWTRALVARVGGADEVVVGDVDARHQRLEALGVAVGELLRRDALALGRLRHRLAVLVGAGEEEDLLAALAHVAGEDVGADRRVRVPEVRRGVDVEDRRGDVVGHRRRRTLAAGERGGRRAPPPQAEPHAAAHRARRAEPRARATPATAPGLEPRPAPARRKRPRGRARPRRARSGAGVRGAASGAACARRGPRARGAPRRGSRRGRARGAGEQRHGVDVAEAVARAAHAEVQAGVVARAGQRPDPRPCADPRAARDGHARQRQVRHAEARRSAPSPRRAPPTRPGRSTPRAPPRPAPHAKSAPRCQPARNGSAPYANSRATGPGTGATSVKDTASRAIIGGPYE